MEKEQLFDIQPHFSQPLREGKLAAHLDKGKEILRHLLPEDFQSWSPSEAKKWISSHLPIVKWEAPGSTPDILTIYFLCAPSQQVKAEKVLTQVIRKWLLPEKEVYIAGFNNMYFYMRPTNSHLLFLAEMKVIVEEERDLVTILDNLPLLSHELGLNLISSEYNESILGTKALSLGQKSTQIQGYLRKLIEKNPKNFDLDLFREMSTFLALSQDEFRKFRGPKHLTRLVVSHYLIRKHLMHHLSVSPEKRHLEFRFIRSKLHFPFGTKPVLGLSLAVSLQDRYETFEESHIVSAVQTFIPSAQIIKGSFYFYRPNYDPIKYLYLELEKKDGTQFSHAEIKKLKRELREELKKRVERLIPSVFMIRNEEEVMRNILLLSQELKYLSDIPQIMVNFEKQEGEELYFTVIAVRVKRKHDLPLEEHFSDAVKNCRFIPDRTQSVGYIRKKNPKEANVFHLCIPKERSILRADSSVNFYLARQKVVSIITEVLGEVRDYNGGMILKQGELLSQLKHLFSGIAQKDQELLENFFFSLNPIEAQATSSLSSLKTLFNLILKSTQDELSKRDSYFQKMARKKSTVFAVLRTKGKLLDPILSDELSHLENFSKSLVKAQIKYQGTYIQGYFYEANSPKQQKDFQLRIQEGMRKWLSEVRNLQELRLSFSHLPSSLDPRLGGEDLSSNIIGMLFEGLTRIDRDSKPALALAKSIDISSDQKHYLFKLRPSKWSDGTPLTAHDFEYAWKKIVSPSFYTPFAYFFYPIKNARDAKKGEVDIDQFGVKALDDMTLSVELENPSPEFLEQTAHALYSPINRKQDRLHPNWSLGAEDSYVCNGPMKLYRTLPNGGYEFIKNSAYWDEASVKLDRITILKNASETAVEMYKNDEIDWLGHPMRPWESYFSECKEQRSTTKVLGAHWCVFNTQRYPFDHLKMRQAFSYAVDRKKIVSLLSDPPQAATSPIPLIHAFVTDEKLVFGDKKLAVKLFEEALEELGLTRENFPIITLIYPAESPRRKIVAEALANRFEEVLGVHCRLESLKFDILFPKLLKGDFQMGTINWKSWINDPFYTLSSFKYRLNRVNFSKWEHPVYRSLLDKAQEEIIPDIRSEYLHKAEQVLVQECPVIPINYEVYHYIHKKQLKDVFCSDSGNIDFKWASIVPS